MDYLKLPVHLIISINASGWSCKVWARHAWPHPTKSSTLKNKSTILTDSFKHMVSHWFHMIDSFNQRILQCDWTRGYFGLLFENSCIMSRKCTFVLLEINPLKPGVAFLYPLKTSANLFLMFSGGIGKQHRAVMD